MRVLVTAASRHGATQGIAEAAGRTLAGKGLSVQVLPEGDFRPWGEIETWADEIAATLMAGSATQA